MTTQTPRIIIPDTWRGINTKKAYEEFLARAEEEEKENRQENKQNNERAGKIRTAIETRIGFDGELIKCGVGDNGLYTYPNVSFAILNIAGKPKQVYEDRRK